ncbi:MAG TPA: hypothetical protein VNL13_04520 [Sulfolobales archaeon]|nr:hypothetical protein [Sulfolobales archaeon]
MSLQRLVIGSLLIFLGLILLFIAIAIATPGSISKGFGIIIIGPIPLVLSDGASVILIISALLVAILIITLLLLLRGYTTAKQ